VSIAERYTSREAYLAEVEKAARTAVEQRHLLEEDISRVLSQARELWDWAANR
jgi:hypothetical protein